MSTIGLTLALLRRSGFTADVCERWLPRVDRRRDLFHVADVVAVHPVRREVLMVQATVLGSLASRVRKVQQQPDTRALLRAGVRVECWGWFQRGGRWKVRRVEVRAGDVDLQAVEVEPRRRTRRPVQRTLFGEGD